MKPRKAVATALGLASALAVWQGCSIAAGSSALPGPFETINALLSSSLLTMAVHLGTSLARLIAAQAIQLVLGASLGMWLGLSRKAEAVLGPITEILHPLPKIAFLPVFFILLGIGEAAKVAFVVVVCIFQTIVSTRDAVKEIPEESFLVARSLGLRGKAAFDRFLLPAILPRLITSARLGLGSGLAALFFAETFATDKGIGYFIMNSYSMADYRRSFAGILLLGLMGLALFGALAIAEKGLCPWKLHREERD